MHEQFSEALFRAPTKEYRGAPFWAWNGVLNREVLREQMDALKSMGFGGFHIHSRIGLSTPYLGQEFMDCVKFCNEYGKSIGLQTWLYDEDKWPSGYGGGSVTEDPDHRARYLLFSDRFYENGHLDRHRPAKGRLTENGQVTLLARYAVDLEEDRLTGYRRMSDGEPGGADTWYAYEVVGDQLPWFNHAAYVDVLNPEAVQRFADTVYGRYAQALGSEFSKSIPAIFTDEPQFPKMQLLEDGGGPREAGIAYTKGLEEAFRQTYGYDLLDRLPEVIWQRADGTLPQVKYHYYNFIAQRFSDTYPRILGQWCQAHELQFTGHLMYEDSLDHQSQCVGDAMRSYPHFQLPGIDVLADFLEYNTAKQAQSVARQEGKPGVASELYGVTNWDHDFRGHKLKGDWQAALGITVRVPHLAWMYMGGESKRDYPAPIDAHSPWYRHYPLIEDHFARVNTVLRRGKAQVRIGVLHPIESYWMTLGPRKQTMEARAAMDRRFSDLTKWLLFGLLDFDFLSEGLLPSQRVQVKDGQLQVGEMTYEAIVVPKLLTIRKTTLELLDQFRQAGGRILLLGELPDYVDGAVTAADTALLERVRNGAEWIGFDRDALLRALEPFRDVEMTDDQGARPDFMFYQMRQEGADRWLFAAHGKQEERIEASAFLQDSVPHLHFSVHGTWAVQLLDTMTGEIRPLAVQWRRGCTTFTLPCHEQDSFLFRLTETEALQPVPVGPVRQLLQEQYLPSVNGYTLAEPNTLLLDQAEWQLDDGSWMPREEILKVDDQIRRSCGMRLRTESFAQPWSRKEPPVRDHTVRLRFAVHSEIRRELVELAFEAEPDVKLFWNGEAVEWQPGNWFVDRKINRIPLGGLKPGENTLELQIPFGVATDLEWCWLLGDFGVRTQGREAVITEMPAKLGFGDYAVQGLPFYGGDLIYETEAETEAGMLELEIPCYAAPVLTVSVDDGPEVPMFLAPYVVQLGPVEQGRHRIRIRSCGSRINQFGQVHNCNPAERYFSPKTWRTTGKKWCYEYRLRQVGVLTAPILRIRK